MTRSDVDDANRAFWNEPAGTHLARSVGVTEITPQSLATFDAAYFELYPYLAPMLDRMTGKVLEVGLGFGAVTSYLAPRVEYHGLDLSDGPVAIARKRLAFLDQDPERIQQGSALELPFPDATFDGVVTIGTLHHTGDLPRGIAQVHRVLRPGGKALVMLYNAWSLRRMIHWRDRPERQRARYDHDSDGAVAPHTDFTSPREARRLFSAFRRTRIEIRNMDMHVFRIPRRYLLGNVDRVVGLDLYITAVK